MNTLVKSFYPLILGILAWSACGSPEVAETPTAQDIWQHRLRKDRDFVESNSSPLPDRLKKDFEGLSYFPIDSGYRFRLGLREHAEKDTFRIITSSGAERLAEKYGYFDFTMASRACTLHVYKLLDIQDKFPNYLFVPFMDATTGKDSYGGGRYLDLEIADSGIYDLDFNLAYNPSCAYGKAGYNCPIPPAENHLTVAIKAGEKYDPGRYH